MLGNSFLVAPKLTEPDDLLSSMHRQKVSYLLPTGAYWYNYISKERNDVTGEWQEQALADLQQATFIKGGSIVPVLLHEDCLALLTCYQNPIRLEIYLDEDDSAEGWLYVDDGTSYDYEQEGGHARIKYEFGGNALTSPLTKSGYQFAEGQYITEVVIYGFHSAPAAVISGGYEVNYTYIQDEAALLIGGRDLRASLDDINIEVVWN